MAINFDSVTVKANDGTSMTVNVPAGPMPTQDRVAILSAAFDLVKDATNWKREINKVVVVESQKDLDTIAEAVEFYTATEATIRVSEKRTESGLLVARVTAPGYYAGPAN